MLFGLKYWCISINYIHCGRVYKIIFCRNRPCILMLNWYSTATYIFISNNTVSYPKIWSKTQSFYMLFGLKYWCISINYIHCGRVYKIIFCRNRPCILMLNWYSTATYIFISNNTVSYPKIWSKTQSFYMLFGHIFVREKKEGDDRHIFYTYICI